MSTITGAEVRSSWKTGYKKHNTVRRVSLDKDYGDGGYFVTYKAYGESYDTLFKKKFNVFELQNKNIEKRYIDFEEYSEDTLKHFREIYQKPRDTLWKNKIKGKIGSSVGYRLKEDLRYFSNRIIWDDECASNSNSYEFNTVNFLIEYFDNKPKDITFLMELVRKNIVNKKTGECDIRTVVITKDLRGIINSFLIDIIEKLKEFENDLAKDNNDDRIIINKGRSV